MIAYLIKKSPKWAFAVGIFLGSSILFCIWWFGRSSDIPASVDVPTVTGGGGGDATGELPPEPQAEPITLERGSMFLSGKSLYRVGEGEVQLVRKDWLEKELGASDQIAYHEVSESLVVSNSSGVISSFDNQGNWRGSLKLSDNQRFDGYVSEDLASAIYVRDRDIWRGEIYWAEMAVVSQRQVTSLGYFQSPLKARLMAASSSALLYREPRLGMVAVNVETGEADSGNLPTNSTPGPNGRLLVGDVMGWPIQLVVFDVNGFEIKSFPIKARIPQNGLAWLDWARFVVVLGNEIVIYNHETGKIETIYTSKKEGFSLNLVTMPSPDAKFIMFLDQASGLICLEIETQKAHLVNTSFANGAELLADGGFLLSSDVPDSDQRGTWLGRFGEKTLSRVLAQPVVDRQMDPRRMRFSQSFSGSNQVVVKALDSWFLIDSETAKVTELFLGARDSFHVIN